MTNEAAVSQAEASYYSIESSLFDLEYQIREMENSLSSLLGKLPAASNAARSTSKFFRRIWWSAFPRRCSPTVPT